MRCKWLMISDRSVVELPENRRRDIKRRCDEFCERTLRLDGHFPRSSGKFIRQMCILSDIHCTG